MFPVGHPKASLEIRKRGFSFVSDCERRNCKARHVLCNAPGCDKPNKDEALKRKLVEMKVSFRFFVLLMLVALATTGYGRTSKEVAKEITKLNKQIESLKKEQRDLKRKPIVKYTEKHNGSGNVIKKIGGVIEVNKRFECGYSRGTYHERNWSRKNGWRHSVCSKCKTKYYEWLDYVEKVPEGQKIEARIEEIDKEIDKIKDEIAELKEERSELQRDENVAKLAAKDSKGIAGKGKSKTKEQDSAKSDALSGSLMNGLVGYWKFDGNADDASGNGNNGRTLGVTPIEDRFGKENGAYRFNGSCYIEVPNSQSLRDITAAITMAAWINPHELCNSWITVMQKSDRKNCQYTLAWKPSEVVLSFTGNGRWPAQPEFELNKWQHVTMTYDGAKVILYRDGKIVGLWPFQGKFQQNDFSLYLGYDPFGGLEYFIGDMDDVRLYNRALSDEEIQSLYVAERP